MPVDTGVSGWRGGGVGGVRSVLGIPPAEFSRAVSTPFPMRPVDEVGRLVRPVPKTAGFIAWGGGGADKVCGARRLPSPSKEGQGEG